MVNSYPTVSLPKKKSWGYLKLSYFEVNIEQELNLNQNFMKRIYFPLFLMMVAFLSGCASDEGEQTVKIENRYSLTIPAFLSETNNLNEDASLQYQNLFKEFYVVVIDEPKDELHRLLEDYDLTDRYEDNVDGYASLIFDGLNESLVNPKQGEVVTDNVNGMAARLTTFDGTIDDIQIFYSYGIYEGQDTYYQVIVWTESDKQSKYRAKMDAILQTLKELQTYRKKGVQLNKEEKQEEPAI